jgi:hypothetical protein
MYHWRWFAALVVFVMPYMILRYAGIRLGIVGVALLAAIAYSTVVIIRSNYRHLEVDEEDRE